MSAYAHHFNGDYKTAPYQEISRSYLQLELVFIFRVNRGRVKNDIITDSINNTLAMSIRSSENSLHACFFHVRLGIVDTVVLQFPPLGNDLMMILVTQALKLFFNMTTLISSCIYLFSYSGPHFEPVLFVQSWTRAQHSKPQRPSAGQFVIFQVKG